MHARKLILHIAALLLALLPAIWLWTLVARYGVEVPYLDDWEIAPVLAKARAGELTLADLFKQEEEARMIVPKLIFLATTGDHWDVRVQMRLSPFICAATVAGIYLLLLRSGVRPGTLAVCFPLIALLIFSPTQFELWLFASGFPSYLPVLFIVSALVLCETRLAVWQKFAGCAFLSLASTFTLAGGLLAWGLTFPVYLLGHRPVAWKRWLGAWLLAVIVGAALYFFDYRKPAHLPAFAPAAVSLMDYVWFLLAFLGNSFAYAVDENGLQLAALVGAVLLTLFLGAALYVVKREAAEFQRGTLWCFAVAFYSIGSAVLATLGRVGNGVDWALSSRYIPFSLYLAVAVIALGGLIADDLQRHRRAFLAGSAALAGVGLLLLGACVPFSIHTMQSMWARNRVARSAILFSPVLEVAPLIKRVNYPDPPTALARAALLDALRLLRPPLIRTNEINALPHTPGANRSAEGWCDAISTIEGERMRASGWAALTTKRRPADAVVLAHAMAAGDWRIFAISDQVVPRRDVADALHTDEQLWSGWFATFPRAAVPAGSQISAWAFDAESVRLYRLRQNVPEMTLSPEG